MGPASAAAPLRARVHCPSVLQMEAAECGAAALAIVLAHFGRWVALEELRTAVGVSRDGSNARSVLRAARAYGLSVKAYRCGPDGLRTTGLPTIVFWQRNHFLVVEGFAPGRWFLNDPATGPREVDDAEFGSSFSGLAFAVEPGPGFRTGGRRPSTWRELARRTRPYAKAMMFVLITSLLLVVPGLAVPALSRAFVDGYVVAGQPAYLPAVLLGLSVTAVLQVLLTLLQQRVLITVRTALTTGIFAGQNQRLLRLSMRFFLLRAVSDVAYRAGLGTGIAGVLAGPLIGTVLSTAVAAIYLAIIFAISWVLGSVVLAAAGAVLLLLRLSGRTQRGLAGRQMRQQIDAAVVQSGAINLIESIKAQGGEDDAIAGISAARGRLLAVRQQQDVNLLPLQVVPSILTSLGTLALLSIGAGLVMRGGITLGSLLAVQILTATVMSPLGSLAALGGQIQSLSATVARLADVDNAPLDAEVAAGFIGGAATGGRPGQPSGVPEPEPVCGAVSLRDVSFDYAASDHPFVDHLDLDLPPGCRVALVGSSGSGKSTVARLVVGLLQPTGGMVLVDGLPRPSIDRRILADGIGFVDQELALFGGTLLDNITLWDPAITDAAVRRALADADLAELVTQRSGGWNAVLGGNGQGLSGGQQQRVEIARALARDPALLVLDEATSALDPLTEQRIDLALRRRRCTTLIVAHRLSTVRDADQILVMEQGRIVERGRHDDLVELDGHYRRLVQA